MAFSFIVLAPAALLQPMEVHRATLEKQWKGILYIGSFMALNIALNNISLLDISLSLNQIIRWVAGWGGGRVAARGGGGTCPCPCGGCRGGRGAWLGWATQVVGGLAAPGVVGSRPHPPHLPAAR